MAIAIMIAATLLIISWLILLGRVTREDWASAAYSKVLENIESIENLRRKEKEKGELLLHSRIISTVRQIGILGGDAEKKIQQLEADCLRLHRGDLSSVNIMAMPGYVLMREFDAIGKGVIHKKVMTNCYELYGKKHAKCKARHILAKVLSYPIIGVAMTLIPGAIVIGAGNAAIGAAIICVGSLLVLVLVYALYDELRDRVKKRRAAISKQFPNVVSKLALLVTSGMVMDRAWKDTAHSHESELYLEMRKTSEELDNLVSPEVAYGNFISRCNTKETAKLASAILQNLSKGNAQVGKLIKDMAREAWQERRHMAKRDAERANSKLMIPTMLLFLAILVILMVPIAMNFSGI